MGIPYRKLSTSGTSGPPVAFFVDRRANMYVPDLGPGYLAAALNRRLHERVVVSLLINRLDLSDR